MKVGDLVRAISFPKSFSDSKKIDLEAIGYIVKIDGNKVFVSWPGVEEPICFNYMDLSQ